MPDSLDPPQAGPDAPAGSERHEDPRDRGDDGRFPWDDPPPGADGAAEADEPGGPRQRHDAFTEARKCQFLRALVKAGCILDACRATGVSARTIYRHQESDPRFAAHCHAALAMSGTPVELTAWQRAVEGVEQEFACGGQVHVRRRYSDGLLRLLLQASNPKKYGPNPGFRRKRLLKHERKQMEREVRAELEEKMGLKPMSFDDAMEKLDRALSHARLQDHFRELDPGWTMAEDGYPIPPGYGPIPGWQAPAAAGEGGAEGETPRDSV